jgi:ATP-binding cassette subfamily F protein uup
MSLISLHSIDVAFDGPKILDGVSLDINKGERICILGRNGAGKSTLMRIINGELKPDYGDVIKTPGLMVSFLAQDVPENITGSAFDIVASALGHIDVHDAWKIEPIVNRVLEQVQIEPEVQFASLSGGLRRRVFLARALVNSPDILLLDEPTNHLDLISIKWLEDFLLNSRLTVMFVTHDRRLLKVLATRIIEIDRGGIIDWTCDYTTFLERKQAVLDNESRANALFDKKLAEEEVWIRKGVKARRTRAEGRVTALKKMREERKKRRERVGNVTMAISEGERSGDKVLVAKDVSFAYGDKQIINDFSYFLMRGERVGIIGPNGCGKTTLLNIMLGTLTPQKGEVEFGANVKPLYFDQLRKGIDPELTVQQNVAPGGDNVFVNGKPRHVISYLQDFLFTSERARTRAKFLSGGERHRLLLARLFTMPSNLLVFDEPTNDLDTETLELLEEVLLQYEGTLIVVSHDREFLNDVVTSALVFGKDGAIKEYMGGYDDWESKVSENSEPDKPAPSPKNIIPETAYAIKAPRKMTMKEKRELESIPSIIAALEAEQTSINAKLSDYTQCQKPGFVAISKTHLSEIENDLAKIFKRWEELDALAKPETNPNSVNS